MKSLIVLTLFSLALYGQALTPSSFLSTVEIQRLKSVFESSLKDTQSFQSFHYAIMGLHMLGETKSIDPNVCGTLQSKLEDESNLQIVVQAAIAAKAANCGIKVTERIKNIVTNAAKSEDSVNSIYYGVLGTKALGYNVDSSSTFAALTTALKKDDGILSLGQAFHVAYNAFDAPEKVKAIFDRIEDAIVQADEIDGKILQFEGGLTVTNLVITGAFQLASKFGKPPPISKIQAVKFANYFMSRKTVQSSKNAFQLLESVMTLTTNKFVLPVAVTLASPSIVSDASPTVRVKITDLLGNPFSSVKFTVIVDGATRLSDKTVIMSKSNMAVKGDDGSLFEINMKSFKPARGFYMLTINAVPEKTDETLVGNVGAELFVKVLSSIVVENAEIGVVDADQSVAAKLSKIAYPNTLSSTLEADLHHKVILKFVLKDKETSEPFRVHQSFVRFSNEAGEEIIFLAELTDTKSANYKFELDVKSKADHFKGISDSFNVELILGDAVASNSMTWKMAKLKLVFPSMSESSPKKEGGRMEIEKQPEIHHLFKTPEVRPPAIVSNAFVILCVLPVLVMFAIWIKLGVNVSSFPLSLSAVGFHLGLGAIFVLYYYFWLRLNMFTTVKYLIMVGIVTFLCGNSMLVKIAEKRKQN